MLNESSTFEVREVSSPLRGESSPPAGRGGYSPRFQGTTPANHLDRRAEQARIVAGCLVLAVLAIACAGPETRFVVLFLGAFALVVLGAVLALILFPDTRPQRPAVDADEDPVTAIARASFESTGGES